MALELQAVSEAIAEDRDQLAFMIETHHRVVEGLTEIMEAQASAAAAGRNRVTVPDSLLFTAIVTPTFDPSLGAIHVLLESGRFALIRDPELRQLLGGWQERLVDVNEHKDRDVRFGSDEVWPRLLFDASHEDVVGLLRTDGAYWRAFHSGTERTVPLPSGTYDLPTADDNRSVLSVKRALSEARFASSSR